MSRRLAALTASAAAILLIGTDASAQDAPPEGWVVASFANQNKAVAELRLEIPRSLASVSLSSAEAGDRGQDFTEPAEPMATTGKSKTGKPFRIDDGPLEGAVAIARATPGRYRVTSLVVRVGAMQSKVDVPPVEIEVRPGQVTYVGAFEARWRVFDALIGRGKVLEGVVVRVQDRHERDAPIAERRIAASDAALALARTNDAAQGGR